MSISVCDMCASEGTSAPFEELTHWQIRNDQYTTIVDLCEKHSGPLRNILAVKGVTVHAKRPKEGGSQFFKSLTVTMDELKLIREEFLAEQGV